MPEQLNLITEPHESELKKCMAMAEAGVAVGIVDGLRYCYEHSLQTPPTLLRHTYELLCFLLKREQPRKGSHGGGTCLGRFQQDQIDFVRWDRVLAVSGAQKKLQRELSACRRDPTFPKDVLVEKERLAARLGTTFGQACKEASRALAQGPASGTAADMKASYFRYRRHQNEPARAPRYYGVDDRVLHDLGLPRLLPRKQDARST